jgi:predicted Zn finger-like uncharacterized protein
VALRVVCPHCQSAFQVADGLRGKRVVCSSCQEAFVAAGSPAAAEERAIREKGAPVGGGAAPLPPRLSSAEAEAVARRPRRGVVTLGWGQLVLLCAGTTLGGLLLGVFLMLGVSLMWSVSPRKPARPVPVTAAPAMAPPGSRRIITARDPADLPIWREPAVWPPDADPQNLPAKDLVQPPPPRQP